MRCENQAPAVGAVNLLINLLTLAESLVISTVLEPILWVRVPYGSPQYAKSRSFNDCGIFLLYQRFSGFSLRLRIGAIVNLKRTLWRSLTINFTNGFTNAVAVIVPHFFDILVNVSRGKLGVNLRHH